MKLHIKLSDNQVKQCRDYFYDHAVEYDLAQQNELLELICIELMRSYIHQFDLVNSLDDIDDIDHEIEYIFCQLLDSNPSHDEILTLIS